MYILNSARLNRKSRQLIPDNMGNTRLWVYPATLYNRKESAEQALELAVSNAARCALNEGTFVKIHDDPENPMFKVVECTDGYEIFRITDDNPED